MCFPSCDLKEQQRANHTLSISFRIFLWIWCDRSIHGYTNFNTFESQDLGLGSVSPQTKCYEPPKASATLPGFTISQTEGVTENRLSWSVTRHVWRVCVVTDTSQQPDLQCLCHEETRSPETSWVSLILQLPPTVWSPQPERRFLCLYNKFDFPVYVDA